MLYPQSNEFRDVISLNGIWGYKIVEEDFVPWTKSTGLSPMAVPASLNEIVTDKRICNHCGKVLYEKIFSFPVRSEMRYRLRIGAVSHKCEVYLNGKKIGEGINGFFPVDLELTGYLQRENRLSIVIDNRLSFDTLPVGEVRGGKQFITFDFYNFTGIHRDVMVYSLPQNAIEDIAVETVVDGDYEKLRVHVRTDCKKIRFSVSDKEGNVVAESKENVFSVRNPKLWSPAHPYLYTLVVETETDRYEQRFGIRKVEVTENAFLLNGQPVYFKGVGMHEDFCVSGKGNVSAVNVRNFELLKWLNANSFRTSHYPYSEEIMDLADEYGMMVIDEVPAAGMSYWRDREVFAEDRVNGKTLELHKKLFDMLVDRDKNHPCVVMYSLANEPACNEDKCREYLEEIFAYARSQTDMPLTFAEDVKYGTEKCCHLPDVIMMNRYYGWYDGVGDTDCVRESLKQEMRKMHLRYRKPVLLSEFGCDTVAGMHSCPSEMFTEEYQTECIRENCQALDDTEGCIGEHVWNFADFKTKQGLTRVGGNKKGIFTRERQPKSVAFYLRERWEKK